MQSRELPRIVAAEAQADEELLEGERPRRPRFGRRLDLVRGTRRLDWIRLALACLLVGALVWSAGYAGRLGIRSAVDWLHAQSKYQLAFTDVELVPRAPEWILGGDRSVLQGVLRNSGEEPTFSVPAVDLKRLGDAFRKSPWVREVREVRIRYPNRVAVELTYRKPVAAVRPASQKLIVLDEEGVILPDDEIDTERVALASPSARQPAGLILLQRANPESPRDRSPGTRWKTSPVDAEPTESDRQIHAAARLAGFLGGRDAANGPDRKALRFYMIYLNEEDPDRRGMVIYNFESIRILWGPAPGDEPVGGLAAEEKWGMMQTWARVQPRPGPTASDEYWLFQKDGMRLVSPHAPSR